MTIQVVTQNAFSFYLKCRIIKILLVILIISNLSTMLIKGKCLAEEQIFCKNYSLGTTYADSEKSIFYFLGRGGRSGLGLA